MGNDGIKAWYVFYTQARWEKKAFEYLLRFGFTPWLPIVTELHQWSDRKKKVQVPLFRSYIFVFDVPENIPRILQIPGISWTIQWDGKPATLRLEEKDKLEQIINSGYSISDQSSVRILKGDPVTVTDGPLKGIHGMILKNEKDSLLVQLDSLDKILRLKIPWQLIKKRL